MAAATREFALGYCKVGRKAGGGRAADLRAFAEAAKGGTVEKHLADHLLAAVVVAKGPLKVRSVPELDVGEHTVVGQGAGDQTKTFRDDLHRDDL